MSVAGEKRAPVARVDDRLRAALCEQFAQRRRLIAAGATHRGWKLGMGERESIGGSIALGHLTTATILQPPAVYRSEGLDAQLHVDLEVAVEFRSTLSAGARAEELGAAIAGYRVALEVVDLAPVLATAEAVVATNVFHRAVAFGSRLAQAPVQRLTATARVDGRSESADAPGDISSRLLQAAAVLDAVGYVFSPGDVVITGSIVQMPVAVGDTVDAELGDVGSVRLTIAR